jgi:hypothetical protein
MKVLTGRGEHGEKLSREAFVDMASEDHQVYHAIDKDGIDHGWSGNPNLPPRSGGAKDGITVYSPAYVQNFSKIKWDTQRGRDASK